MSTIPGVQYFESFLSPSILQEMEQGVRAIPCIARSTFTDKTPNGTFVKRGPVTHRGHELAREKAFFTLLGRLLLYSYTGFQTETVDLYQPIERNPTIKALLALVEKKCGQSFNHVIVTKYNRDGDCIGWHNDKNKDFVQGTGFAVVTFGHERPFQFRANPSTPHRNPPVSWETKLARGSLLVVSGEANQVNQHRVPKADNGSPWRISAVFRNIKTEMTQDQYRKRKAIWTKRNKDRAEQRVPLTTSQAHKAPLLDVGIDAGEAHKAPLLDVGIDAGEETETDDYTKFLREEAASRLLDEEEPESDEDETPPKRAKTSHAEPAKGDPF